jgi:tetratricopeptide (TPR) repeat protein
VAAAPKPAIDLRVAVAAAAAAVAPTPRRPDPPGEPTPAGRLPVAILRAEVLQAHAGLAGASHFQILGLMREATLDDVRAAYRTLVRRYHPDGYVDPAVSDLRDKAVALFVAVGDSYAVLSDPGRRAEYERELQRQEYQEAMRSRARAMESGIVADSHASAAVHLARAEEALGTGQTAEAIRILEAVLPTLQPPDKGRGQVLLGRAYMTDPNPHRARDAERILQEVLREDPQSVDAQVCLGTLYGQRGLRNRARRMYRSALEIDPTNAEALREIARMDQEDAPPAPEPHKPLLQRLFRPR